MLGSSERKVCWKEYVNTVILTWLRNAESLQFAGRVHISRSSSSWCSCCCCCLWMNKWPHWKREKRSASGKSGSISVLGARGAEQAERSKTTQVCWLPDKDKMKRSDVLLKWILLGPTELRKNKKRAQVYKLPDNSNLIFTYLFILLCLLEVFQGEN